MKIFYSVSAKIKSKPSIEDLKKSINYSNEFRKQALKVNTIRKELFDYPIYYNGLNYILPFSDFVVQSNQQTYIRLWLKNFKINKKIKLAQKR